MKVIVLDESSKLHQFGLHYAIEDKNNFIALFYSKKDAESFLKKEKFWHVRYIDSKYGNTLKEYSGYIIKADTWEEAVEKVKNDLTEPLEPNIELTADY